MRNKIGDLPTVELVREDLARYAREADQSVVQAESAGARATSRPGPATEADMEVSVEVEEALVEFDDLPDDAEVLWAPTVDGQREDPPSEMDHDRKTLVLDSDDWPPPTSVPCVIACREDLAWFGLEETSNIVLAMIDGESTIEAILTALPLSRAAALAILGELLTHGVIELH
jgi:hypothetical protein